jgi:hypothetical protein
MSEALYKICNLTQLVLQSVHISLWHNGHHRARPSWLSDHSGPKWHDAYFIINRYWPNPNQIICQIQSNHSSTLQGTINIGLSAWVIQVNSVLVTVSVHTVMKSSGMTSCAVLIHSPVITALYKNTKVSLNWIYCSHGNLEVHNLKMQEIWWCSKCLKKLANLISCLDQVWGAILSSMVEEIVQTMHWFSGEFWI